MIALGTFLKNRSLRKAAGRTQCWVSLALHSDSSNEADKRDLGAYEYPGVFPLKRVQLSAWP